VHDFQTTDGHEALPALRARQFVTDHGAEDSEEPGANSLHVPQFIKRLPGPDTHLLNNIFRVRASHGSSQRKTEQSVKVR
jgi:hypothetical protein